MKHAGEETIRKLMWLLGKLRERSVLKEKSTGIFYLKSKPYLHFHDDSSGIFADAKLDRLNYSRHRVSTLAEQTALLRKIDKSLSA